MEKGLPKTTLAVFVLMHFVLAMFATLFNGILDQVAEQLSISVAETGLLNSFYAYGAGIGVPVTLIVFRKVERTRVLKGMLAVTILATVWMIYAPNFIQLLLARFITGVSANSYGVLATATVASFANPKKLGSTLSTLLMGSALALVVGVPLIRYLSGIFDWRTDFWFLNILMSFALLYYIRFLPKADSSGRSINFRQDLAFFKEEEVQFVLLSMMITFIGYGGFYTYMTPYLLDLSPSLFSIMSFLLVLFGLASFTGNHLGGIFADRIGYKKALVLGTSLQALISLALFVLPKVSWILILLLALWSANAWFIGLQLNTGITSATKNKSSFMLSLNGSGNQLGQALGTSLAALLISKLDISFTILLSTVTAAMVLLIYRGYKGQFKQD